MGPFHVPKRGLFVYSVYYTLQWPVSYNGLPVRIRDFRQNWFLDYQNIDAKMGGWQEKTQFNSQSILNHYYHDPYNHLLRKTQNPNNDTHVLRLDTIYGGAGDLHWESSQSSNFDPSFFKNHS